MTTLSSFDEVYAAWIVFVSVNAGKASTKEKDSRQEPPNIRSSSKRQLVSMKFVNIKKKC